MPLLLKGKVSRKSAESTSAMLRWRFLSVRRHDIHPRGKSQLCRQAGQFWKDGKEKGVGSTTLWVCYLPQTWHVSSLLSQRMIAKTVKIVRGCRSQPYGKGTQLHMHVEVNPRCQVCTFKSRDVFVLCSAFISTEGPGRSDVSGRACNSNIYMWAVKVVSSGFLSFTVISFLLVLVCFFPT